MMNIKESLTVLSKQETFLPEIKMADVGMSLYHFFFKILQGSYFTLQHNNKHSLL
eukprot:403336397